MTGWTKAWVTWGTATVAGFTVIEGKALRGKVPGGTLSEHLRTIFGFDGQGPAPEVRQLVFLAAWAWFGIHIWNETAGCVLPSLPTIPPS